MALLLKRGAWIPLVVLAAWTPEAKAQDMAAPVEVQVSLLLKVLAYDRGFAERSGDAVVIGIVYQRSFRVSLEAKEVALQAGAGAFVQKVPVRFVAFEVAEVAEVTGLIQHHALDALYIAPLRALPVPDLVRRAHAAGVLTLTGVPDYVREGAAVGIGLRSGRPEILIHHGAARAAGARLSAQLLKLARLVDRS